MPIRINGTENHVHILCYLPKAIPVAEFVRTIKSNSSKWFKSIQPHMEWQKGYAAFGVSKTNIPNVISYIQNQKEHHRHVDFAEEMNKYLGELGGESVYKEWFEEQGED